MKPNYGYAEELWAMGCSHAEAAETLWSTDPSQAFNGKFSAAIHLLHGFAFELLLKSTYLANGGPEAHLQQKKGVGIGHNLVLALDCAVALGARLNHPQLRGCVEAHNLPHAKYAFRYSTMDFVALPPVEETVHVLKQLSAEVARDIPQLHDHFMHKYSRLAAQQVGSPPLEQKGNCVGSTSPEE